jgi:8-oxo-dGTP pyrophosphatase MutT (NUDIX family)
MDDFAIIHQQLRRKLPPPENLTIEAARARQAAVSLILRDAGGQAQLLMIERAQNPRDHWSGHLALPGGRAEAKDADLLATAARETQEEVGMNLLAGGSFIGRLGTLTPRNPRLPVIEITPLVALAPPQFSLQLSAEVAAAFWVPVGWLKEQGRSSSFKMTLDEIERQWPAYPSERGPIWGITERILTQFLTLLD